MPPIWSAGSVSTTKTISCGKCCSIYPRPNVGCRVLLRLNRLGKIHHQGVQRAGFAVLKSPDIPSVLVETAFITNPLEERKLTDPRHQGALAAAILDGIRAYFLEAAPPGTLLAMHKDTLSDATPRALR